MSEQAKIAEIMAREYCCGSVCQCPGSCEWDTHIADARKTISALSAAGYAIVPRELTQEMLDAGVEVQDTEHGGFDGYITDVWEAILDAAESKR